MANSEIEFGLSKIYIEYPDGTIKLANINIPIGQVDNLQLELNNINNKIEESSGSIDWEVK